MPLGPRVQIDQPEIFMLNLSPQEHKSPTSVKKDQVPGSTRQRQRRQWVRRGIGRDRFHRKSSADVGTGIDSQCCHPAPTQDRLNTPRRKTLGNHHSIGTRKMWVAP